MARTIVLFHPGALGDLLLAVPAIRSLRLCYPNHRFVLCAQEQAAALLGASNLVDEWVGFQGAGCAALFTGSRPEDPVLLDCLSRCDLAVAWVRDEAGMLATGLKTCGAVDAVVQSPFAQVLNAVHQSDRYAEILGEKVADVSKVSSLLMPEDLRREAQAHLQSCGVSLNRPFALLHPGSGSRHKCMSPSIWRSVTQALNEQGLPSLLLEGPADRAVMQDLLDHLSGRPILLRDLPLRPLAGVLTLADLFVGHDSGVTHLAALLGVPTVALFGPTDPARWAPRGTAVTVLQAQPCHCTSWDMVKNCGDKPCLNFSPSAIVTACQTARAAGINPRNT